MARHRIHTMAVQEVYRVSVPFCLVEANHQEAVIVTMDDEWLTEEQLKDKAARIRRANAQRRKSLDCGGDEPP